MGTIYRFQETSFVLVVPFTTSVDEVVRLMNDFIDEGEAMSTSVRSIWDAYVVKATSGATVDYALEYCRGLVHERAYRRVFFYVRGTSTPAVVQVLVEHSANHVMRACAEVIRNQHKDT